jgi:hypothetical protein
MGDERSAYAVRNIFSQTWHAYEGSQQTTIAAMPVGKKIEKCLVDSKLERQRLPFLLTDNCVGSTN